MRKLSDRAVENIKKAWVAGVKPLDLAIQYDVEPQAIHYRCRGLPNPSLGKTGRPRSFSHERAKALVKQGFTLREVASRFGVTYGAVAYALRSQAKGEKAPSLIAAE